MGGESPYPDETTRPAQIRAERDYFPTLVQPGLPRPESAARRTFIHSFALVTLTLAFTYLAWRLLDTVNLDVWWVAIPLILAEGHNTFGLLLYTLALWDIDAGPAWRPVDEAPGRIAILIPTYNEPNDVLLPGIAAALAVRIPHETWVLDDGKRPEVARLCHELGAEYLTRPDNAHAKAGNLNHAIDRIQADFYAIFDADHVPSANFLRHTLCYFDDPKVALVQTPQEFYNQDSFVHAESTQQHRDRQHIITEESVFYRVIAPGKNRWGAAFWCGTGAVVRGSALRDVGGVATDTITEDIHTTMKLNRRGWKAVFHNEVLAMGLGPADALQYMLQRNRWAVGAMQTLRVANPLLRPGYTWGQRLGFATTLIAWFDTWRTLAFILIPAAVIFSGASPIDAPGNVYAPLFLLAFSTQFIALRVLARGYYSTVFSLVFEMLRLPAALPATLAVFTPDKPRRFSVTPKGRTHDRERAQPPLLLVALLALCGASLVWFCLSLAGLSFTHYSSRLPAVIGSVGFVALNFAIIALAVIRIRRSAFSGERRGSTRFDVFVHGTLAGKPCIVRNLSLSGARVEMLDRLEPGDFVDLVAEGVRLKVQLMTVAPAGLRKRVRLRFLPAQSRRIGDLVLATMKLAGAGEPESSYRTSRAA